MSTQNTTSDSDSTVAHDDMFRATDYVTATDEKVEKRANWEEFSFRVLPSGNVLVLNMSHAEPAEHAYVVTTDSEGLPKWCLRVLPESHEDDWEDCPACKYHCENYGDTDDLVAAGEYEVDKHQYAYAQNTGLVRIVRAVKRDELELADVDAHEVIRKKVNS